jgi:hypothetical protein
MGVPRFSVSGVAARWGSGRGLSNNSIERRRDAAALCAFAARKAIVHSEFNRDSTHPGAVFDESAEKDLQRIGLEGYRIAGSCGNTANSD